jgi:hypothetical protein
LSLFNPLADVAESLIQAGAVFAIYRASACRLFLLPAGEKKGAEMSGA